MSRPFGRAPYRKPIRTRVGELLTTSPTIWLVGFTVGMILLIVTNLLGIAPGLLLALPLVVVAPAGLVLKARMLILRRRILLTRQRTSRRQFLAMTLSVSIVAGFTAGLGWLLRGVILANYDAQVRRQMAPRPQRPPK